MSGLTRVQRKNNDRIQAWLKETPFIESSKAKPAIPLLPIEQVLEQYIPIYNLDRGGYYTPLEMTRYLLDSAYLPELSALVLEPCCGIGNMVYVLQEYGFNNIDAFELDSDAQAIFQKLFPDVRFTWCDAFDKLLESEDKYDMVLVNPPFGLTANRYFTIKATEVCKSGATKSEHFFLELALRAVRPGGSVIGIAPWNWLDSAPKKMQKWLDDRIQDSTNFGVLPGEFEATKIKVHGWQIWKNEDEKEVVKEVEPVQQNIKPALDVKDFPYALEVPDYVLEGLTKLVEHNNCQLTTLKAVKSGLRYIGEARTANWIGDHCQLSWGIAFYHGVKSGNSCLKLGG